MIARVLFVAGALPYIVLGAAHAFHTPRQPADRKGLSPRDPQLGETMANTIPRLTPRTNMWLGWVGFNLSHSLGVVGLGILFLVLGRSEASFIAQAPVVVPLAVLVASAYLWIGVRYWFRIPIIGCALSLALFLGSWAVLLLAKG